CSVSAPCPNHYHTRDFSNYQLLRPDGSIAVLGHKQAFCLEDLIKYGTLKSNGYTCANQGITTGWADWYFKQLSGQWIDITGVPEGDYVVRVTINAAGKFAGGPNREPKPTRAPIHVPDPPNKATVDTSGIDYSH